VVPRAVYDQPAPSIRVSPTAVSFQVPSGGEDANPQPVSLVNGGALPISWSAVSDGQWLAVVPSTGVLGTGQTAILSLVPSSEGLPDGEHAASLIIGAPGSAGHPQIIAATLRVGAPPPPTELIIADQASSYRAFGNAATALTTAQTFVATAGEIRAIAVGLSRAGSPAQEVTAAIRSAPNGPDLATVQLPAVASTDYRSPSWVVGTFPVPVVTTPGETYVLVLGVPAANKAHYHRWSVDSRNPYPGGTVLVGTKIYSTLDATARIIHIQP
jgi:hypothetical protein